MLNLQHNGEVKTMNIQHAKKGTIKPIKPFQTIAEEAEFWDTHEATSEINEGTLVGFHQANKTDTLTIRFSHEDITRLREEANQQGVGPSTLARMLVKKGLQTL
jgi:predicted DNA binding CopG/RHH family protein